MPRTPAPGPTSQTVKFTDDLRPAVGAGTYTLTVTQEIDNLNTFVDGTEYLQPTTHDFVVRAPQFHLDASCVHALYPPPGMNGAFHSVLPHIALSRALLPWERSLAPGSTDTDGPAWLALLVLTPADKVVPRTWTVREALADDPSVRLPALEKAEFTAQEEAGACTTVDLSPALAAALLPARADLNLLAHVRSGGTDATRDDTPAQDSPPSPGEEPYSVIIANRFPAKSPGTYTAHLVSLEGHHTVLGTTPDRPVRMFSLASWAFTSHPDETGGFGPLAEHLAHPEPDKDGRTGVLRRPLPAEDDTPSVARLRDGYLPLAHHTAPGPCTFAWYRGPLIPVPSVSAPVPKVCTHPSQALIYVKDSGVFDVSYANAFSLGRALALADPHFTTQLAAFRRTAAERLALMAQHARYPVLMRPVKPAYTVFVEPTIHERWYDGGTVKLAIHNHTASPLKVTTLEFDLSPGQTARNGTHILVEQNGNHVTGTVSKDWPPIPAGENRWVSVMIQGDMEPFPASFKVNGTAAGILARSRLTTRAESPSTGGTPDPLAMLDSLLQEGLEGELCQLFTPTPGAGSEHPPPSSGALRQSPPVLDHHSILAEEAHDPKTTLGQPAAHILPWLNSLALLTPVPFAHLVPDPTMLPDESLRFFHIDETWQRVLRDGALSIGRNRSEQGPVDKILSELVSPQEPSAPAAGILIRSALVRGWPALTVTATDQDSNQLKALRYERLDQDTLLVLFDGVPQTIELAEPHQGLHFGVTTENTIELRSVSPDNAGDQETTLAPMEVKDFLRRSADGIETLRAADLAESIARALRPGGSNSLTPSEFALQMIKSSEKITLQRP
ncbi:cellulose binding domain-containing protein [Streptomyces olivoreticuli]|uniref:cellulose binding domain-containing protein n=1 Tax=Streptomyces olivoreticuli TaxID=68246 RepID=UPI000E27C31B|nr:cellulose binding domain-containing protein [Streptomyces olivoreticuli]